MGVAHACLTRSEKVYAKEYFQENQIAISALENPSSFQFDDVMKHIKLQELLQKTEKFIFENSLEFEANKYIQKMAIKEEFYMNKIRNICNYFDNNWTHEQSWYGKKGRLVGESENVKFNRNGKNKEVFKQVVKNYGKPDDFEFDKFFSQIETEKENAKRPW